MLQRLNEEIQSCLTCTYKIAKVKLTAFSYAVLVFVDIVVAAERKSLKLSYSQQEDKATHSFNETHMNEYVEKSIMMP